MNKYHVKYYYLATGMEGIPDTRDYGVVYANTVNEAIEQVGSTCGSTFGLTATLLANNTLQKQTERTQMNETMRLRTQSEAIAAVKGNLFIVGSVASNGDFSVSASPTVHRDVTSARMEARRLAGVYPGKMFVLLNLTGGELVPTASLSI